MHDMDHPDAGDGRRDAPLPPAADDQDPGGADTQMFRAFVERGDADAERPRAVGAPFRIVTLLIGLVVFAVLVWLLLQG